MLDPIQEENKRAHLLEKYCPLNRHKHEDERINETIDTIAKYVLIGMLAVGATGLIANCIEYYHPGYLKDHSVQRQYK